ncbi:MAG: hypothetical protein CL578_16345 [Alteromonadaceae bacterium]|nr:hypothetical protein [Alteromonadaceae bacterium]
MSLSPCNCTPLFGALDSFEHASRLLVRITKVMAHALRKGRVNKEQWDDCMVIVSSRVLLTKQLQIILTNVL